MNIERERLVRFFENDLPEAEERELRARLDREPELRARLDGVRRLVGALRASTPESFAIGFSDRVVQRLVARTGGSGSLYDALRWVFPRAAAAGLTLAAVLGVLNLMDYQALEVATSTLDALFGLPSASVADALSYGSM